jgi:transcriptional regulator with XRE-family HTH domain
MLRHWRAIRGMTQRELADRAGVSARHLAFVETGKAHPSRDAVTWLARALRVPEDEEGAFLEAAGYLAAAREAPIEALREDLARLLAGLEPRPALIHDARGTIIAVNRVFSALAEPLVGPLAGFIGEPGGGHRFIAALSPHLVDAGNLAGLYVRRVRDALLRGHGDPPAWQSALFSQLAAAHTDDAALDRRRPQPLLVRVSVRHPSGPLELELMTATLGTPEAIALRALRLIVLLPLRPPS